MEMILIWIPDNKFAIPSRAEHQLEGVGIWLLSIAIKP
jgi:hypothetical protein